METIKDLKEEISSGIQDLIDEDLETIRVYLDSDDFNPDTLCAALERAEENLVIVKEKSDELTELISTQNEMERAKEEG